MNWLRIDGTDRAAECRSLCAGLVQRGQCRQILGDQAKALGVRR